MKIDKDDLIEPYSSMAEIIGVDGALALAELFGGEMVYFPLLKSVYRSGRNRAIIEDFNGYNFRELAKKYDLTEAAIRIICREYIQMERSRPSEGQVSFFEE